MKREGGFIYPQVLAAILFFLFILGAMTMGFQKEMRSAELTISFYKKQQLFRIGASEAARTLHHLCEKQQTYIHTEEGRVTVKQLTCDQKKKRISMLVSVKTKDGLSDERELVLNGKTREIMKWANSE
ncbi:competence type IV pilus minor pilin ComGG [Bacillus altitudinis]|uniref:competence type IV pilus minor pilin ComGG n=1 Tax=Bacillus pumilus TaxID=1408 RepID=UPI0025A0119C|nr:competence type IV pilus minor pilin ComGG [Bacillus pumilus]MDM5320630.1 competence type IV pilus minor pilin ComGG [Bacillus pumilus]MDR4996007.1 competence type IV pilus minor pilin ComGG [Bacillus altitudinis]